MLESEDEGEMKEMEECEADPRTLTETSPPPTGPSGLVIVGLLVQKHSYVSALIIMMVNYANNIMKNLVFLWGVFKLSWSHFDMK